MFIGKLFKAILPLVFISAVLIGYYLYTPKSAKVMDEKIESSDPEKLDTERFELSENVTLYLAKGMPKDTDKTPTLIHLFFGNQRKLLDLRIGRAIKEIKATKANSNEIYVWSMINMGVVVKTENKTIAFGTSDMPLSSAQKKIAEMADIILTTHGDADHYDPLLLKKALEDGKTVILPKDYGFMYGNDYPNLMEPEYDEEVSVDGVKITAFQTDHRGDRNFAEPNAWYLVRVDGFTLLHTGDGMNFKNEKDKENLGKYGVDIFLANRKNHPYDVRDVSPKILVPLHLYKFQHNREELSESTFEYVTKNYNEYQKELAGIDIKLLFTGEYFKYIK